MKLENEEIHRRLLDLEEEIKILKERVKVLESSGEVTMTDAYSRHRLA